MQISIQADANEAATSAADFIANSLRRIVEQKGQASLALSGGSTPKLMYTALSALELPWRSIHILQVDERVVSDADQARNSLHIVERLVSQVDVPASNWHPMPVEVTPLSRAAKQYSTELQGCCAGRLDVIHLGLGDDGHTASWPPDDSVQNSAELVDSVREFNGFDRLTLTPRAVNQARVVTWLVVGSDKSNILKRWQEQDPQLPSSMARRSEADALFTDKQAQCGPG